MKERLKKRLMLAMTIFNRTVFGGLAIAVLYFGNWIFVSDKFIIPTDSMTPTLIPGDRIVVNKLIFGARIYKNLDFSKGQPLVSWRMPGLRRIRTGDVLVFNDPSGSDDWGQREFKINYIYAKRCIGTPGDTVSVERGFYRNFRLPGAIIGLESEQRRLADMPDSLIPAPIFNTMPFDGSWTIRDFGPLWVPGRGDTIRLDDRLRGLYGRVIEYETGRRLADTLITSYVFRDNYYFVGGDNVMNSGDSRYWGFVPEEFIVGVTRRIAYSRDRVTNELRRGRMWRKIPD
ncbi:MAG: signal peptidase I [Lachnoclostridium sp.]|jgi:signal peptidase I|nr:signal peptidase I [Lachnoclostridium sp.]